MNLSTLKKEAREEYRKYLGHFFEKNWEKNHITIGEDRYAENRFNEYVDTLIDKVVDALEESVEPVLNQHTTYYEVANPNHAGGDNYDHGVVDGHRCAKTKVIEAFSNFRK